MTQSQKNKPKAEPGCVISFILAIILIIAFYAYKMIREQHDHDQAVVRSSRVRDICANINENNKASGPIGQPIYANVSNDYGDVFEPEYLPFQFKWLLGLEGDINAHDIKTVACILTNDEIVSTCSYAGGGTIFKKQQIFTIYLIDYESGGYFIKKTFYGGVPSDYC